MERFENTVTIARPIAEVFAFLADFENLPVWNHAIEETRKTSPGPVGVGTTYRQTRSVPTRTEEEFQVTVFEPVGRLEIQGLIGPFRTRATYTLEQVGDATRLVNQVEIEPSSGAVRLLAPLVVPRVKNAVRENLIALKEVLEGGGRGGAA